MPINLPSYALNLQIAIEYVSRSKNMFWVRAMLNYNYDLINCL